VTRRAATTIVKVIADQIKAITGRIHTPEREIHRTDDHFNVVQKADSPSSGRD
jgi:hypothetical protein